MSRTFQIKTSKYEFQPQQKLNLKHRNVKNVNMLIANYATHAAAFSAV